MNLTFVTRAEGAHIHCSLASDTAAVRPIFCCSLMAPAQVISGGELIKSIGGYCEVALPDLVANEPYHFVLAHKDVNFLPGNRAWLPLSPYLRVWDKCFPLPAGRESGVTHLATTDNVTTKLQGLPLVPPVRQWQPNGGTIAFKAISPHRVFAAANQLAGRLQLAALTADDGTPTHLIHDAELAPEAYRIRVTTNDINITAASDQGFHNAAITLLNLRESTNGQMPCGEIFDAPRFQWRGQHLDCARHFYAVETILRLLDLMALLKLNRFHWHFADDEAFRLQVDCTPALWQKTAFRGEGEVLPGVFGGGIRAGGSYSKADVNRILDHARGLHIEVLPEIEVPAHAFGLNKVVPGLRDPHDSGVETSIQGYLENVINPAMQETWRFLPPLMQEIAGLFPIGILHLGCDELPPGAWSGSPAVAELKKREGLHTSDDVQGWMMERLARDLANKGIRPAAWEEAAKGNHGGIGHNALLFSWTGQGPGLEAARRGHDIVMCPAQHTYFDHAHSAEADDWGALWAGILPLEKTVDWDPVPEGAEDVAHRIIGVQSSFWSEFTTEDREIEAMIAPRILGLACKAWETNRQTTTTALLALASIYMPLFQRMGWKAHRV